MAQDPRNFDAFPKDLHGDVMRVMMPQLVIACMRRLAKSSPDGKTVRFPVSEVDDTGQHLLMMRLDQTGPAPVFEFVLEKKS